MSLILSKKGRAFDLSRPKHNPQAGCFDAGMSSELSR
jgi:hypothetical protein